MRSLADLHCCTFFPPVMFLHGHIVLYCTLCTQKHIFFNQIHRKSQNDAYSSVSAGAPVGKNKAGFLKSVLCRNLC